MRVKRSVVAKFDGYDFSSGISIYKFGNYSGLWLLNATDFMLSEDRDASRLGHPEKWIELSGEQDSRRNFGLFSRVLNRWYKVTVQHSRLGMLRIPRCQWSEALRALATWKNEQNCSVSKLPVQILFIFPGCWIVNMFLLILFGCCVSTSWL